MKKGILILALFVAHIAYAETLENDSVERKSFGQKLLTPVKWLADNWSAYDPQYCLPSFYNWAGQLQNTTSFEWVNMATPQGMKLNMRSRVSNRIGPYFGWRMLLFGATVDLSTLGKPSSKGKNEFTLSINSSLFNIDFIRRRTGGDFMIKKFTIDDPYFGELDLSDVDDYYEMNLGDFFKNSLTGVNVNYFLNYKKYSNTAAFSHRAVQLRSAGSPVVGLGYTHQKVTNYMSDLLSALGRDLIWEEKKNVPVFTPEIIADLNSVYDENNLTPYLNKLIGVLDMAWPYVKNDKTNLTSRLLLNTIPTETVINDWHLQLGYAYNLVFSRRLMLGMSAIVSPSLKYVKSNNQESFPYMLADDLARLVNKYRDPDEPVSVADDYKFDYKDTYINVNTFLKASLVYNFNRWRAGITGSFSNYLYGNNGMRLRNTFGSVNVYVGYCFGRKKVYRYDGKLRKDYVMAALTPSEIEEMKDSFPESNLHKGTSYASVKKTRYRNDEFVLDIEGCDLVRGPEGKFGWYELKEGFVAPGEDTEGRLSNGKIYEIDEDGEFTISAGHHKSFRAGNWWKSHLKIDQIPNQWYPEQLHYALCGKLTLYLRGRIFGTKKPVKLELDSVYINHGSETQGFFQIGINSFRSKSSYSIEGRAKIRGRNYRIYIEQKQRGNSTVMYVSRVYPQNSTWMSRIEGRRPVSTISMPGTHDSGTSALPESPIVNSAHTQNFSVPDQLRDGIRAFDIRLKKNLKYGHTFECRESFDSTMVEWDKFLTEHPSEVIVAMVGVDGGGAWSPELIKNYQNLIDKYPHRFVEKFDARTTLDEVRGKILVICRQEDCPFGKLLKFSDNTVFEYDCFHVEDVYKEHKTWRKARLVERHLREAFESDRPNMWYITFNSVAWSPRRHTPYAYAWGGKAKNIRRPLNKALHEMIELKDYVDFGIVFLDYYNDHGEHPHLVESIIESNFHLDEDDDYEKD